MEQEAACTAELLSQYAAESDPTVRQQQEQLLVGHASRPYFMKGLLSVVADKAAAHELRLAAVDTLRKAIAKNWKSGSIPDVERNVIRDQLIHLITEEDPEVRNHLAITIGVLARNDDPEKWDGLLAALARIINDESGTLKKLSAMQALHQVMTALVSKRLIRHRRVFQEVFPKLFPLAAQLWTSSVDIVLSTLAQNEDSSAQQNLADTQRHSIATRLRLEAELAVYCLKVISDVLTHGHMDLNDPDHIQFLHSLRLWLAKLVKYDSTVPEPLNKLVCKWMQVSVKMIIRLQRETPATFQHQFLADYLAFCHSAVISKALKKSTTLQHLDGFLRHCMVFIRHVLIDDETQQLLTSFFTPKVLLDFADALITNFFILAPEDLVELNEDTEQFLCKEQTRGQDNLVTCAEDLFVTLLRKCDQGTHLSRPMATLCQMLWARVTTGSKDDDDMEKMLMQEAYYRAIGLGAYHFYHHVDFASWFSNQLENQLRGQLPSTFQTAIIRRRIVLVIGEWSIMMTLPRELRPSVYEVIISLLPRKDKDSHIAVRFAAANTLRLLIDSIDFDVEEFLPFLGEAIISLCALLLDLQSVDMKQAVLVGIITLIDQTRHRINGYQDIIGKSLADLWEQFEEHHILQCSVIRALTRLIKSLLGGNDALYQLVVTIIQYGTEGGAPQTDYLLEDSLKLWAGALKHMTTINDGLLSVFPILARSLTQQEPDRVDCMKLRLHVLHRYVISGGRHFMLLYADQITAILLNLVQHSQQLQQQVIASLATVASLTWRYTLPCLEAILLNHSQPASSCAATLAALALVVPTTEEQLLQGEDNNLETLKVENVVRRVMAFLTCFLPHPPGEVMTLREIAAIQVASVLEQQDPQWLASETASKHFRDAIQRLPEEVRSLINLKMLAKRTSIQAAAAKSVAEIIMRCRGLFASEDVDYENLKMNDPTELEMACDMAKWIPIIIQVLHSSDDGTGETVA